jgi:hypothetical protein
MRSEISMMPRRTSTSGAPSGSGRGGSVASVVRPLPVASMMPSAYADQPRTWRATWAMLQPSSSPAIRPEGGFHSACSSDRPPSSSISVVRVPTTRGQSSTQS